MHVKIPCSPTITASINCGFGDLIDSALDLTLKPGLQAAATAYLKPHDAYSAATDPDLLRSANAYLSSLDIDAVPSHTILDLPEDDSYAFTSALVHMTSLIEEHDGARCLIYELSEQSDPTQFSEACAHSDGGSMVTTTHDPTLV